MDMAMSASPSNSSQPDSFKLDRKSPLAAHLMRLVSHELRHFIGDYTDDVLAEYVVVLVCNGKTRNQAKDDLEAFLGDRSGSFVAWLWDHLSRCITLSEKPTDSLNSREHSAVDPGVDEKPDDSLNCKERPAGDPVGNSMNARCVNSGHGDLPHCDAGGPQNHRSNCKEDYVHETFSSKTRSAEAFERWCPEPNAPLAERGIEELYLHHGGPVQSNRYDEQSGGSRCELYDMKSSVESPVEVKKNIHIAQIADQQKKMDISYNKRPAALANRGLIPRNVQSIVIAETDSSIQRSTTRLTEPISHENPSRRGNVWDRLGKPREEYSAVGDRGIYEHGVSVIERKMLEPAYDHQFGRVESDGKYQKPESYARINTNSATGDKMLEHLNADRVYNDGFSGRKRKYIGAHIFSNNAESSPIHRHINLQDNGAVEMRRSLSGKNGQSNNNMLSAKTANSRLHEPASHQPEPLTPSLEVDCENVTPIYARQESYLAARHQTPSSSTSISKFQNISNAESGLNIHAPVEAEAEDVKMRLKKLEKEITKLRPKESGADSDNASPATLGTRNCLKADVDSRTAFVSNVHFAASTEALSLHFSKCGEVVKVTLLMDTVTGQPKGCAYVVFMSKDSVEKALALSGTSLYSRILKVVRKVDLPSENVGMIQSPMKIAPAYVSQFQRKSFSRQFSGSHMQWRRDVTSNSGNART